MPTTGHAVAVRPWDDAAAHAIIAARQALEGPLLPILHGIQEAFGYVDARAVPLIAAALNLSRADVHGVISFYHDFRAEPAGRHVIRLCRAEACQSMGSDRLAAELERALGIKMGGTTPDGRVTLEATYCLGNCALSPAAMIDGKLHGRIDASKAIGLVRGARA
jgi:formate dehydrogenase subunit gamma